MSEKITFSFGAGVTLTPGEAKAVQAALDTVRGDYTAKDAERFGSESLKWAATGRKAAALRRFNAAVATQAASTTLIGEGRKYPTYTEYAKAAGVSKAQVTGLVRLGKAIANGYGPTFPSYPYASRQAGHNVGNILISGTPDEIHKVMTEHADANKGGKARPKDGSDTATETTETPADAPAVSLDHHAACKAALAVLREHADHLNRDEWSQVEDALGVIVAAQVQRLAPAPVPRPAVPRTPVRSKRAAASK
jgi:hypothetical protein